jgi:hypothetical protein
VPLCPPQIPHDLTWVRTQAAAVGSRRLTSLAMGQPFYLGHRPIFIKRCPVNIIF